MPFFTRPRFEDREIVQWSGETISLSGQTFINNNGYIHINGPLLDFTGSTSASTQYVIAGVSGYINVGETSSFIVQPPIILQSGSTGTTTVDVTGYILGGLDATGRVTWYPSSVFFSGGTGTGGTTTIIQFTGNTSASCITDLWVTNVYGCGTTPTGKALNIQPTGNDTTGIGLIPGSHPTYPLAILQLFGNTGTIPTFRITNSGGSTHLDVDDLGHFNWDNGSALVLKTGTSLTIETGASNGYILTSDASGNATWQPCCSTGSTSSTFTGNTSADCITNLYVSNLNSCSPLNIQNISSGDVLIGANGGVNVGIGTISPGTKLEVSGKTKTIELQVTDGAVNGYVLTSDALGNATWQPASTGGTIIVSSGSTSPYVFGPNIYDIVTLSGNNFTLSNTSIVLGGINNVAQGFGSSIINGEGGTITGSSKSVIINGINHWIETSVRSIIGNGTSNSITGILPSRENVILNGSNNSVSGSTIKSSIINGSNHSLQTSNSLIGCGTQHSITNGDYAGILLGDNNSIIGSLFSSTYSLIGGGVSNSISNSTHSFIGNGTSNVINNIDPSTPVSYSTILGGTNNTINYSYSSINGGQSNSIQHSNTHIIGSNITTTANDTTYTEKLNAGASSVNSYQGHLNVNDYNTVGPIRPNYISPLLTSGNTTGGTWSVTIPAGWVVEDILVYIKTSDLTIAGTSVYTSGGVWSSSIIVGFSLGHNIFTQFTTEPNGPHYFASSDTLFVNFVDAFGGPTTLTTGEYKVFIKYWDGTELGIF